MAKMKEYQIFRCPHCQCEYYNKDAVKGKSVGDPMLTCPECGKKSYRSSILEPALISEGRYFDIKFSSVYGNMRIVIILILAVFLFAVLVKRDAYLSIYLVCAGIIVYAIYGLIRAIHMYIFLKSDEYDNDISRSLSRLEDEDYAQMIIHSQKMDRTSVYYYQLHNRK
ncbi:MAG: hypothetical protein LUH40_05035 [Clostridiales bacterium]|nr:hypothetical protein [Clostridiales bacterium]